MKSLLHSKQTSAPHNLQFISVATFPHIEQTPLNILILQFIQFHSIPSIPSIPSILGYSIIKLDIQYYQTQNIIGK